MNKKILVILGIIIVLALIISFSYKTRTNNKETIKIGAMLPMTGPAGIYGECQYNGALLAVEETNKNGGVNGQKLELILQDTKGDVKEGVNTFNNIKGQVKTVITAISGIVLSVGSVADKDHVVVMNIGAKSPKISQAGDYVFSTVQNSDADEIVFAQYVKNDLKLNNIAVIAVNNDYGLGTSDAFAKAFVSEGGKIVGTEKYEASATDFRTILTKIKVLKPEGIFIVGYKEQGLLLKQATSLGIKTQWLAPEPFASPDIIALAGVSADGVIYHAPGLNSDVEPAKSYFKNYEARFNKPADFCSANSYDGVKLFIKAISAVGNDGEKIKNWLYNEKNWISTTGSSTFNSNGDVLKALNIMTVKDGKFVRK